MRTRGGSWSRSRFMAAHLSQQFLHAPDRHHGEDVISVWWQETLDLLKRLCPSGVLIIAKIDANAELGSEVSPFIGGKDAAQETEICCFVSVQTFC